VSPGELAKALNLPLVGEVPYYPEIVEINNEGVSVFFNRRKPSGQATEYAAAFKTLARKLIRPDSGKGAGNSNAGFAVEGLEMQRRKSNFEIFR
jgi:hypothetical protein